jgi:hypothetical protein
MKVVFFDDKELELSTNWHAEKVMFDLTRPWDNERRSQTKHGFLIVFFEE